MCSDLTRDEKNLQARARNWLPIAMVQAREKKEVVIEEDFFSKAKVLRFYPRWGRGWIVTGKGEELVFDLKEARLVGNYHDVSKLTQDCAVGFDASWVNGKRRVTKLKIYNAN